VQISLAQMPPCGTYSFSDMADIVTELKNGKQVTIRLPEDLWTKAKIASFTEGMPLGHFIVEAITDKLGLPSVSKDECDFSEQEHYGE